MASYKHRQNLVDLLNQIQVPTTTTSQDLNAMIGSISREITISYFDMDLTKKGKHHNDPLHITVDAKGKRIPMVLINDGSALNVCPLKTTSCLGLSIEDFVPTDHHVKAYDNSRKGGLGNRNTRAHYRANDQERGISSPEHIIMLQYAPWVTMDP